MKTPEAQSGHSVSRRLERDGEVLLKPFCPPYYKSMADAVQAVVEIKIRNKRHLSQPGPR